MKVLMNCGGLCVTNCFLVADEVAKVAVLFDAPDHTVGPLLDEVSRQGWDLAGLWLTHGHFDHIADHGLVRRRFPDAKILMHPLDVAKAQHPEVQTRMFGVPLEIEPVQVDTLIAGGDSLRVGLMEVRVIHTPGHSPGHVGFYFPTEELLIGGDLIIGGSVGRTDLPGSVPTDLDASIQKIMQLPGATRLLGGHGEPTTLEYERKHNQMVQMALRPR